MKFVRENKHPDGEITYEEVHPDKNHFVIGEPLHVPECNLRKECEDGKKGIPHQCDLECTCQNFGGPMVLVRHMYSRAIGILHTPNMTIGWKEAQPANEDSQSSIDEFMNGMLGQTSFN